MVRKTQQGSGAGEWSRGAGTRGVEQGSGERGRGAAHVQRRLLRLDAWWWQRTGEEGGRVAPAEQGRAAALGDALLSLSRRQGGESTDERSIPQHRLL